MIRPLVLYVDVDDTLVRSFGSKRIPMARSIESIKRLAAGEGVVLYCWSSGGAAYAEASARELGIHGLFQGFLPKPNVCVDDVKLAQWPDLLELHPNEAETVSVNQLRERLEWSS